MMGRKNPSLKPLAQWIVPILLIATIASCRPTPTAEPNGSTTYGDLDRIDPSGQIVIYWHHYSGEREETLLEMVDEFNATNEWGIAVVPESVGSIDALYEEIQQRAETSALPNLVTAEPYQIASYVVQDDVVELSPYVEHYGWGFTRQERRDFFPFVFQTDPFPQQEGVYSLPFHRSMEVLYYNEDWLYELGYTAPPRTWDEFREMACTASDPEAGTTGYTFAASSVTFTGMLLNRGGQLLSDRATEYAFGNRTGLDVLTFVQELLDGGCMTLETMQYEDQDHFGTGRALFIIDSITGLPFIRRAVADGAGFDWSITPLPTELEEPIVSVYGVDHAVLRTTAEGQLASWLFARWFVEPEQQARWIRATHYFPVCSSSADLLEDYLSEHPQYEIAFGFLSRAIPAEPALIGYDVCREGLNDLFIAAASDGNPTELLAQTLETCNRSLDGAVP
jgi:ABC-type glycerol-3-phosphate transport system substrate-binding protein